MPDMTDEVTCAVVGLACVLDEDDFRRWLEYGRTLPSFKEWERQVANGNVQAGRQDRGSGN